MTEKARRPAIFGAGLITLDVVYTSDDQNPIMQMIGGTCGNVLSILRLFGWNVYPVARLDHGAASKRVLAEFSSIGAQLDYLFCAPVAPVPTMIERIKSSPLGPCHSFSTRCPNCESWLPGYRAVTRASIGPIAEDIKAGDVYFFDRASAATISLAAAAAEKGAIVMFEPSATMDSRTASRALAHSHIVKYAEDRQPELNAIEASPSVCLEIVTRGSEGVKFRRRVRGRATPWISAPALKLLQTVDTCGAGDWFTAAFLNTVGKRGLAALKAFKRPDLASAICDAQAYAAWNCLFPGARGSTLDRPLHKLRVEVAAVKRGRFVTKPFKHSIEDFRCPRCR